MNRPVVDRDALSAGFSAGAYAQAYDGLGFDASFEKAQYEHETAYAAYDVRHPSFADAFVLGYYASFEDSELDEGAFEARSNASPRRTARRASPPGTFDAPEEES